jgi:catechol 2,3-dioxygenase-like lactoylglutathione lyase family enzyme
MWTSDLDKTPVAAPPTVEVMKVLFVSSFAPITRDPAASQRLYRNVLGLPLDGEGDYVFTEKLDGVKHFGVWPLKEAAQACFGTDEWPADIPVPQASLEFDVDDVPAAAAELVAAGHRLLHEARTEPWGQTVARVLSPEGIILGVGYSPWMHGEATTGGTGTG